MQPRLLPSEDTSEPGVSQDMLSVVSVVSDPFEQKNNLIVKSKLNAFPSRGGNIPIGSHQLERFQFLVCRQSLAPERNGLHHGPINQQRKLWIKAWTCLMDAHDKPVWHPTRTHPPQTKNTYIFVFIFWFQLSARSSQLLINDYFPFRLEQHGKSWIL